MKLSNKHLLMLVIVVGSILRLYDLTNIPFTVDEYSALFRLDFQNFSELIDKGVKVDGHPAGIHVFLYYWVQIFGLKSWIIKLPFIVCGILSLYFIYKIAAIWFNETVGLLSASFLATMQFTVMYSQIARPYISGLLFSLMMVYYLSKMVKNEEYKFYINYALFILSATLCAYNHHFSLLFALIVGISGLLLIPKRKLLVYSMSALSIFVLYLPHLPIFLHQLSVGGVGGSDGWLGKPDFSFITKFIAYIFGFSFFSAIMMGILIFVGIRSSKGINLKSYILFFLWFVLPIFIGFIYSIYFNPVLQYSVLIFSLPYLFFILFGHFDKLNAKINLLLISIVMMVNISILIFERQHYKIFYYSIYDCIVTDIQSLENKKSLVLMIDANKRISSDHAKNAGLGIKHILLDTFQTRSEFKKFLSTIKENNFYYATLSHNDPLNYGIIKQYFPNVIWQKNHAGGNSYLFSKNGKKGQKTLGFWNFENKASNNWTDYVQDNIIISDSNSSNKFYFINKQTEYALKFVIDLKSTNLQENDFIDISLKAKNLNENSDVLIVSSLDEGNINVNWSASDFKKLLIPLENPQDWKTVIHSIKFSDIQFNKEKTKLQIYIWNRGKNEIFIDDFSISIRKGNPIIYGLFEKIYTNTD